MAETLVPPQSDPAEMAVLGSMLIEREAVERAVALLTPEDFYNESHREIFKAAVAMAKESRADIVTVSEALRKSKKLDSVGGKKYLSDLQNEVATAAHIDHYAGIVRNKAAFRQIISIATRAVHDAYREEKEPAKLVTELQREIFKVLERNGLDILDFQKDLGEAIETLTSKQNVDLVPTGFPRLDALIGEVEKGEVVSVGARTSSGKTAVMTKMAVNIARTTRRVLYITTEMSKTQMVQRILPMASRVDAWKFRKRAFDRSDAEKINHAHEDLSGLPLLVMGKPRITLQDIQSAVVQTKPDAVFVDYLQRVRLPRGENRAYEIEEFMAEFKTMASDFKVAAFIAAQLDRGRDKTPNIPPVLADFKGSSAIEAESDLAMLLWQPPVEVLAKRMGWSERPGKIDTDLIIAKGRNSCPAGAKVHLLLDGQFVEMIEREQRQEQSEMELQGEQYGH